MWHLAWRWKQSWTTGVVFCGSKALGTKAVFRQCSVWSQQTFLWKRTLQIFSWKKTQHESRIHLVCVCLPTAARLKCEPGFRWVTPGSSQISPVRISPECATESRALASCVCFSACAETIAMAALSRQYMQSAKQLCLVIGSWTNHKSQAVFFLYALTMAARGLIHWSCMTAIWRVRVCVFVSVSERRDVGRYAHHEVALHASQQHLLPSLCVSPVGLALLPSRAD